MAKDFASFRHPAAQPRWRGSLTLLVMAVWQGSLTYESGWRRLCLLLLRESCSGFKPNATNKTTKLAASKTQSKGFFRTNRHF